jgi:hypothetical protein
MRIWPTAFACAMVILLAARACGDDELPPNTSADPVLLAYEDISAKDVMHEFPSAFWEPAEAEPQCGDGVDCGAGIDPAPVSRGRWTALTELTVLVPSYSDSTFEAKHRAFVGPRLILGWESASGFGIRGRGWGFDGATRGERNELPYAMLTHELLFSGAKLDLDFYKRIRHSTGDFAFGVGLTAARLTLRERYAGMSTSNYYSPYSYSFSLYDYYYYTYRIMNELPYPGLAELQHSSSTYQNGVVTTSYDGSGLVRNTGAGVGLMMEGTHRFYETPRHVWSAFGRGRVAYLVGEWEATNTARREGDANMALGEATLGVQYTRRFRDADLSLLCGFEMQSWDVSVVDRITLAGVTTGLGVNW